MTKNLYFKEGSCMGENYTLHRSTLLKISPFRLLISLLAGFLVMISLLSSAGCVKLHVGFDFPEDQVQNIQLGKTTKEEIRKTFGEPWRVGLENGLETWTYGKYSYSGSTETSAKDLVVRFTKKDVVESYTFSKTNR
jgi:outer membrane protein assembly factor BamE (lipoprotein component of BamABCDE complex)